VTRFADEDELLGGDGVEAEHVLDFDLHHPGAAARHAQRAPQHTVVLVEVRAAIDAVGFVGGLGVAEVVVEWVVIQRVVERVFILDRRVVECTASRVVVGLFRSVVEVLADRFQSIYYLLQVFDLAFVVGLNYELVGFVLGKESVRNFLVGNGHFD